MSHYSARSPRSKKVIAINESSLGTGTEVRTQRQGSSHEAAEEVVPYLPSLTHNRIFKMVKETRSRLHGSRRDQFSRLDSVKSSTPTVVSLTPKSTLGKEETVAGFLPNAPLSTMERFLEFSNESSMPSPRKLHAQAGYQSDLPRGVLPTPRLYEKNPTHREKCTSEAYVKFKQIRFHDGKADVVNKKSLGVFSSSPENVKKSKCRQRSKAVAKDVKPPTNDFESMVDVSVHFVRRQLTNSAA